MKAEHFPFTTGDLVTVTTWGRVPENGTLAQVDDSGLTLQLGFRAARWIPWSGIRDVEISATEGRIREIAAKGAQPVVPHPALTDGADTSTGFTIREDGNNFIGTCLRCGWADVDNSAVSLAGNWAVNHVCPRSEAT